MYYFPTTQIIISLIYYDLSKKVYTICFLVGDVSTNQYINDKTLIAYLKLRYLWIIVLDKCVRTSLDDVSFPTRDEHGKQFNSQRQRCSYNSICYLFSGDANTLHYRNNWKLTFHCNLVKENIKEKHNICISERYVGMSFFMINQFIGWTKHKFLE